MASIIVRTDDKTGETLPADAPTTTVRVNDPRWDHEKGSTIVLDLSDTTFKALVKALEPFWKVGAPPTSSTAPNGSADAAEAKEARAWALANPDLLPEGVKANERGKVATAIIEAFRNAEGHATTDAINAAIGAGEKSR